MDVGVRATAGEPRMSVTRRVVNELFRRLRSGTYRVGDRLPSEWELVESLGAGRSAVREAIRELVALDLVELQHGRGTYVKSLRPDLLLRPETFGQTADAAVKRELLEVRLIVEPAAAALASERASTDDVARLRQDVDRLSEAVEHGYRPPEDVGFHLDVVRATHNGSLARVAGAIVGFYQRDDILPTWRDVDAHRALADAIAASDGEAARRLMREHLEAQRDELRTHAPTGRRADGGSNGP